MAFYLHAVEGNDGWWTCHQGWREFDAHPTLEEAIAHLKQIGVDRAPVVLFAHALDGNVTRIDQDPA